MTEPNVREITATETTELTQLLELLPSCGATQHDFTDANGGIETVPTLIFCRNCGEVRPLEVRR